MGIDRKQESKEMSKRYEILIENRDDESTRKVVVEAEGYKQAWTDARTYCRLGNEDLNIQAGIWIVRKVYQLDKKTAKKKFTAEEFHTRALENRVNLSKPVLDLLVEFGLEVEEQVAEAA